MSKTKSQKSKKVRFAKLRKQRITRKLRSRRRRNQPMVRDCSWMNLPITRRFKHRGGGALKPAEIENITIRDIIPVVGNKAMYSPETGSGSYYGYNMNPSLPDPDDSNNLYQRGGSILPRDLVDLGRNAVSSMKGFYNTLTTQPISESSNVMEQPIGEKNTVIINESSIDLEKIL